MYVYIYIYIYVYLSNIYTHLTAWCLVISKGAFRMATMTSKWEIGLGLSTGHLIIVMWRRFTYYVNFEAEYIVLSHIHPRKHANDLDGFYWAPLQNCSFSYLCHTVQECDFVEYDTLFFPQTDGWVEVSMKVLCKIHESTDFNRNNWQTNTKLLKLLWNVYIQYILQNLTVWALKMDGWKTIRLPFVFW